MTNTRWWTYLERLMGEDNAMTAANRAGISASNFTRWKKGARADPDFVVKIARAYNANVLEALVESEFITPDEAQLREINPRKVDVLRSLTDTELAEEQRRRAEHTIIRIDAGMTKSDVEEQMARAVQMGLLSAEEQAPVEEQAMVLAFQLSKAEGLQSDYGLAARRTGQRKGSDPAGLDDGEE